MNWSLFYICFAIDIIIAKILSGCFLEHSFMAWLVFVLGANYIFMCINILKHLMIIKEMDERFEKYSKNETVQSEN